MNRTAQQARFDYELAMGPELGGLYHTLWQEAARLYAVWGEYRTLYGKDEPRFKFLMAVVPGTFHIIGEALHNDILLRIAKLTGPATSGGRLRQPNITVQALAELIGDASGHGFVSDAGVRLIVETAIKAAVKAGHFAKAPRDKWIAHLDRDLMLDPLAPEVTLGSRLQIASALEALTEVLNATAKPFGIGPSAFDSFGPVDGAERLVQLLELAQETEERELQARLGGEGPRAAG